MKKWGRKEPMKCKEFEKLIPGYLADKLDYPALKRFFRHMQECADCKEELEIQFLVAEGIHSLEKGNAFDFQAQLRQRMEETGKTIRFHRLFLRLGDAVELAAVGMLAGIVVWILW